MKHLKHFSKHLVFFFKVNLDLGFLFNYKTFSIKNPKKEIFFFIFTFSHILPFRITVYVIVKAL